jgi:transcriptional regulator with XRE-family HTH domain
LQTSISPELRRRRLAAELRRLRGNRTGEQAAKSVGWSPSKLSRYELGRTSLDPDEVAKLLDAYHVKGREREWLMGLAHDAAQRGWWEDFADALSSDYLTYISLEAEAVSVANWEVYIVPGLLQTEDYSTQVHVGYQRAVPIPPGIIRKRVEVRMKRQEALTRSEPLEVSVVLDESVLLREIGGPPLMHSQLLHMARLAELPNVQLQVLPLRAQRSVIAASFTILRFGTSDGTMLHDVVTTETFKSEFYVEGEADTYEHRLAFDSLATDSLSSAESQDLIVQIAERVWT